MEERHYLIGTAGHVDHGKTELIRALSGMETDNLKEEKQRGISIELGFAHMKLPSERLVGIVDVPGHEKFVRQMLAGASGMDLVLLVVAADEGIMPQTQEHLDILTLLGVSKGIVVINKIDLVDEEWLEFIQEDIKEKLTNTGFQNAPICKVSAIKGQGISDLKETIDDLLSDAVSKNSSGPVRMPLDRVFSVQGFGTVVTGTLHSGTVKVGQELAIEPGHLPVKIRSIQVYKNKVDSAKAGQRVAVNLAGADVADVTRGSVLVTPKAFKVGKILDIKVYNLSSAEKSLIQRQRVRFHLGTNEILGRIHLLDHDEILPGQEGFAQILLEESVIAASGDRFVLRFYSPAYTIGGGKVLGVADFKQKRFHENVIALMKLKDKGDPLDILEKEINEPRSDSELVSLLQVSSKELKENIKTLLELERLEVWSEDGHPLYWGKIDAERWRSKLIDIVKIYEEQNPLRGGISREELKTRLGIQWPHRRWQTILEEGSVRQFYRIVGSKVQTINGPEIPPKIQRQLDALRIKWQSAELMPPDLNIEAESLGISKSEAPEYAQYLCDNGEWVHIDQYYYRQSAIDEAKRRLIEFIDLQGELGVAEAREMWGTTRKYAVPILEYFDNQKVTKRIGDKRKLN